MRENRATLVFRHNDTTVSGPWIVLLASRADTATPPPLSRNQTLPRLQLYAHFLEEVQGNIGLAQRYYHEAEKADEAAAAARREAEGAAAAETGEEQDLHNIDEARDCVVVITPDGTITFTNSNLTRLFGCVFGWRSSRSACAIHRYHPRSGRPAVAAGAVSVAYCMVST